MSSVKKSHHSFSFSPLLALPLLSLCKNYYHCCTARRCLDESGSAGWVELRDKKRQHPDNRSANVPDAADKPRRRFWCISGNNRSVFATRKRSSARAGAVCRDTSASFFCRISVQNYDYDPPRILSRVSRNGIRLDFRLHPRRRSARCELRDTSRVLGPSSYKRVPLRRCR